MDDELRLKIKNEQNAQIKKQNSHAIRTLSNKPFIKTMAEQQQQLSPNNPKIKTTIFDLTKHSALKKHTNSFVEKKRSF